MTLGTALLIGAGLLHAIHAAAGGALQLRRLSVPQYKIKGEMAMLQCIYDLGDDALYSVKWYKDDEEFYRYVPRSHPVQHSYRLEGIRVDQTMSNDQQVVLRSVNLKSSGDYRCEVSAEAPSFASAQAEGHMEVVSLPKDGPHIYGEERLYQVGDEITLNCTSGKSYPASELSWFINDKEVPAEDPRLEPYPTQKHPHGLLSSSLGLRFIATAAHFVSGSMRVRCVAEVAPVLWQGDQESVVQKETPLPDTVREALFLVRGSSGRPVSSVLLVTLATWVGFVATTSTST